MSEQNQFLKQIGHNMAVIATDQDGNITVFNQGAEKLLGYQSTEMIGHKTPLDFHLQAEIRDNKAIMAEKIGHPITDFELFTTGSNLSNALPQSWTYIDKEGQPLKVQVQCSPIQGQNGDMMGMLFTAMRDEAELVKCAKDLPGEHLFEKQLNIEMRRMNRDERPLGLLQIKLDHYDELLEAQGPRFIKKNLDKVAVALRERIRRAGDFLSFVEKDEFYVLLPNTPLAGVIKLAEKLRLLIENGSFSTDKANSKPLVTISIGATAIVPERTTTTISLFSKLRAGLEQAIAEGGNKTRIG